MFKTIDENVCAEIVEKKSKFIAHSFYVESVEQAEELIKQTNKKYFDARHNCYAFRVMTKNGVIQRFSDDGEPSGTAGGPMLNILTSQNLANVLVIVTRYFGGILLGTGGLVKAYSSATLEALNRANRVEKVLGREVKIRVSYADLEKLKYYLKQKNCKIVNVEYDENVSVMAEMTELKLNEMLQQKENLNFGIVEWEIAREKFIGV